jgi:hypothetical protein
MVDDDADTFTSDEELERVRYAIERLHAVAGACLRGLSLTAIDAIADAADNVLSEIAGPSAAPYPDWRRSASCARFDEAARAGLWQPHGADGKLIEAGNGAAKP